MPSSAAVGGRIVVPPGGGLRIFGCVWRVADDDFVFPAWLELIFRLAGLAVAVAILVFQQISRDSCAAEFHLDVYLAVAVVLFALTSVDLILLAVESARGSIWDRDPSVRWRVVPLVYVNIALTAAELLWALVGSVWVVRGLMAECVRDGVVYADVPVYAILAVVLVTWVFLFLKVIVSLLSFNTMECSRSGKQAQQNESLIAEPRPGLKSRIGSLFLKKSQISMFRDVGNVLSEIFDDDSFVPTDLAAALILLYARQHAVPHPSAADGLGDAERGDGGVSDLQISAPLREQRVGRAIEERAWDESETVSHFMAYAGAAYGYTWFLMRNTALNFFQMYPYLRCACCCCLCPQDEGLVIEADNCCTCNTAALRAMLPHLDGDSLVHISFHNKMAEVPFFVAVDHSRRKIVIAIRGTLSLEDTLTDLCAKPESMGSFHEQLQEFVVHSGMFKAARYVHEELRNKNILNKALSYFDDYELVVTGHSLGAGTAVILTFMLRQTYHATKCYAFSPPGGLLNQRAAAESEKFTLSVIMGKDLVSRLSLHSIARLKDRMKATLSDCKLPKYQILSSGLSACCAKDWRASLDEEMAGDPTAAEARARSVSEDSADSRDPILRGQSDPSTPLVGFRPPPMQRRSTLADHEQLFLPGRIWHVEGTAARGEQQSQRQQEQQQQLRATVRTSKDFQDILVSPKMLTDHFPNNVYDALRSLAQAS